LGVLFFCAALINVQLGAKKQAVTVMLCFVICFSHLAIGTVLAWDFITASFSSIIEWEHTEVTYLQPRTG
jgi:hypothetical protein